MSDRIGQLTARLQAHGVNFMGAGGGRTVDAVEPLDIAHAFGCIKGAANQAIASYYYSVGNDRHGAVDALYLILAREQNRQDEELLAVRKKRRLDPDDESLARRESSIDRNNWPNMARKGGNEYQMPWRIRDVARIVIDEKSGRIKTDARIAQCLGIDKSNMCRGWSKVVSFARAEMANALAAAEGDILEALK